MKFMSNFLFHMCRLPVSCTTPELQEPGTFVSIYFISLGSVGYLTQLMDAAIDQYRLLRR